MVKQTNDVCVNGLEGKDFRSLIIKNGVGVGVELLSPSDSCNPMDCSLPGSSVYGISYERMLACILAFLLQRIFLTQGLNPHLLNWQADS